MHFLLNKLGGGGREKGTGRESACMGKLGIEGRNK